MNMDDPGSRAPPPEAKTKNLGIRLDPLRIVRCTGTRCA